RVEPAGERDADHRGHDDARGPTPRVPPPSPVQEAAERTCDQAADVPPIAMPGMTNVMTRLSTISDPMPVSNGLMPLERIATNAAPMSPNTAPEAPTALVWGARSTWRNEPPSSASV